MHHKLDSIIQQLEGELDTRVPQAIKDKNPISKNGVALLKANALNLINEQEPYLIANAATINITVVFLIAVMNNPDALFKTKNDTSLQCLKTKYMPSILCDIFTSSLYINSMAFMRSNHYELLKMQFDIHEHKPPRLISLMLIALLITELYPEQ